jgi:hypothetical protein
MKETTGLEGFILERNIQLVANNSKLYTSHYRACFVAVTLWKERSA